ncbi:MAG: short chain dehydrogenase [Burkholderiales bacterium]|nr:short chain dehydrogenase [Burkholderiales bacterium]
MKILLIGGSGTIGKAIVNELSARHEIIIAGRTSGDVKVDITDKESIKKMYQTVGNIDAVIISSGKVHFGRLEEMTDDLYQTGLQNKLMGQVNVVLEGIKYLNNKGSFTLTSGILNREPIELGSSAAMVNGALDGFVKHAAIELPKELRINIISPTVITEALGSYAPFFRGFKPVLAADAAMAYSKSVEGLQTGQIFIVG